MSWDVVITKVEVAEDSDSPPPSLGSAEFVRDAISSSLPSVDWSDPAWGTVEGEGWSLEFNLQQSGDVLDFMIHVRGGGDPLQAICRLCRESGWVALDTSTGEYIALNAPSDAGWKSFQNFRDGVLGELERKERRKRLLAVVIPLVLAMFVMLVKILIKR